MLNDEQKMAVDHFMGPCVVTAAPGAGKTRVITSRVANLIEKKGVDPRKILCLTFTNKAADEMKTRISAVLKGKVSLDNIKQIWISTFHKLCISILHKYGHHVGVQKNFNVYDDNDQIALLSKISRMNGCEDCSPKQMRFLCKVVNDYRENLLDNIDADISLDESQMRVSKGYLDFLKKLNAVDFSGILHNVYLLLKNFPDIQEHLNNRFRFVMVDECQDTNIIQYEIIKMLSVHSNLFVVGDPQQSIYYFRNSRPENINLLRKQYGNVKDIILPKNYRSTNQILKFAESIIKCNSNTEYLDLISNHGDGDCVTITECLDGYDEAQKTVSNIINVKKQTQSQWKDFVVLYRTNSLSRTIESCLRQNNIPYKVVGGLSFYDRSEIKTAMAYLSFLNNHFDSISFERCMSYPKRGVGSSLIGLIEKYCIDKSISVIHAIENINEFVTSHISSEAKSNLLLFRNAVLKYSEKLSNNESISMVCRNFLSEIGYYKYIQNESLNDNKSSRRIDNLDEFLVGIEQFEQSNKSPTISKFLQSAQLLSSVDDKSSSDNVVTLSTIHASKGLEWMYVSLIGVENGQIPHYMSKTDSDIEEERRVLYVACTRAAKMLFLYYCLDRKNGKRFMYQKNIPIPDPSRFLMESYGSHEQYVKFIQCKLPWRSSS